MTDNRTTELREKLTERGVEWTKPKSAAEFIKTTFLRNGWGIEVLERNIGLCVTATNVFDTPEQAIAATLGSDNTDTDDALALLDEIREAGRISYDDYSQLFDAVAMLGSDAKPCYATDYTHGRCKYSVNRGWTEDTKFYVPTLRNGTLTAEQVRECVQHVYHEGYSDGSVRRGAHIDETDWQAIADELNAETGGTCKFEINTDMTAVKCSECGYNLPKGTDLGATRFCGGCGKAVER